TLYVTRVARRALADATGDEAHAEPAPPVPPSLVQPDDEHNRVLISHVHPPGWTNPTPAARYDLVVVGGGTAGLVSAAGAAGLGARVALVERHLLGGDCLNVGCVPSKAMIAAARTAATARETSAFGVRVSGLDVDFAAVMERMRRLRAGIAPHDGAERFTRLGVDVFLGEGRFTGRATLEVDGRRLTFTRAVVATGARATAPPIPGLEDVGYLTNETVFWLTELPRRLAVEAAGVACGRDGVTVNDYLQTTNRRIYAAGDVASRFRFTHMADALARIVLANALFGGWKKASALHVPWCTYTSPEVAHVGL